MDRLEQRLKGRAELARVNVFSESAEALSRRYRVNGTPTYLVLDARGGVAYRQVGGSPDSERIEREVDRLLSGR